MTKGWKIRYYKPVEGTAPVYEFVESLSERAQSKLIRTFDLLKEYGVHLSAPHAKKVSGTPLWELRILGDNSIRIFYIAKEVQTFLMLHGFKKKTQKTPRNEIKTAVKRLQEYRSRQSKKK